MDLYKEILASALSKEEAHITFPNLKSKTADEIVELRCYSALKKIWEILREAEIDDIECFMRIEKIISLFENDFKTGCGLRHDF